MVPSRRSVCASSDLHRRAERPFWQHEVAQPPVERHRIEVPEIENSAEISRSALSAASSTQRGNSCTSWLRERI